jgi:hypothetical protein
MDDAKKLQDRADQWHNLAAQINGQTLAAFAGLAQRAKGPADRPDGYLEVEGKTGRFPDFLNRNQSSPWSPKKPR